MTKFRICSLLVIISSAMILGSCALMDMLFAPDLEQEKEDRFLKTTGHNLLKIYVKEDKLGYIFDNGVFIKKVWGGKKIVTHTGQSIKLTYTRESFDKLKLFIGEGFDLGPHLQNIHHVTVYLEDIYQHQLSDLQPMIEYMGKENAGLLEKDFVASMLKVTKFSVEAYQKVSGEFGAEYRPYQLPLKVRGSTGTSSGRTEEQVGYNIFVGYRSYNGSDWIEDFEQTPKVDMWILNPKENQEISQVRAKIKGSIINYRKLHDDYKNRLRVYLMSRDAYEDEWVLQSKTTVNSHGWFEGIVKLGTLEKGDGHRYSIAAFATYFDINRDVNSRFLSLPFNKGKYVVFVDRRDKIE